MEAQIDTCVQKFRELLNAQLARTQKMQNAEEWTDYEALPKIKIGVCGGDGIGPIICDCTMQLLRSILEEDVAADRIEFISIPDLTFEKRVEAGAAVPPHVIEQMRGCHVLLKGPTHTPRKGESSDPRHNIPSANVACRMIFDLFANCRPVRVPEANIDWMFFRENTEGAYVLGSSGVEVGDVAMDFKVITTQGCDRIIRMAFDYAKKNGKNRVSCVTKANVVKTTDGKFLNKFYEIAREYPDIQVDDWYIDIFCAKMIDESRRSDFQVIVAPNLYGDIITDEAAQIQGGVGTAGSANIGKNYAMFEAIHGSADRMVEEGRAQYANPASMMRCAVMLLQHIGYLEKAQKLERALDICDREGAVKVTGRSTGATAEQFCDYVLRTLRSL